MSSSPHVGRMLKKLAEKELGGASLGRLENRV